MRDTAQLQCALLNDLGPYLKAGEPGGPLTSDMTVLQVRCRLQAEALLKKFEDVQTPDADARGLEKFLEINRAMASVDIQPPMDSQMHQAHEQLRAELEDFFHVDGLAILNFQDIAMEMMCGPGAQQGAQSYNFYTKLFDSPLTFTNRHLLRIYRSACLLDPKRNEAERLRSDWHGEVEVVGNKLFYVPKTVEISRTAATEPALNVLTQVGIGKLIRSRLKRKLKIALESQQMVNKRFARHGSFWQTFATIDLESASDCISMDFVRKFLPASVRSWLEIARSPSTVLPDGTVVPLNMAGTMGNGYTFPLQTAIFGLVVVACYKTLGIKVKYSKTRPMNFGVYGDDIIVRRDAYEFVLRMLQSLGFRPNVKKSFNSGSFRESCGGDYWNGQWVRPVYVKSLLGKAAVYSAFNRLMRWSERAGVQLKATLSLLLRWCGRRFLVVPYAEQDIAGIKLPLSVAHSISKTSWYKDQRAWKYYCYQSVPLDFSIPQPDSDAAVVDSSNVGRYYQRKKVWEWHKLNHSIKFTPLKYNSAGLLTAVCGGFIRDGRIGYREVEDVVLKVVERHTSSWDAKLDASALGWEELFWQDQLVG